MGISINTPGSVNSQASMTGTLSIRKSTNTFEQMTGVKSSGGTSKKQLNRIWQFVSRFSCFV